MTYEKDLIETLKRALAQALKDQRELEPLYPMLDGPNSFLHGIAEGKQIMAKAILRLIENKMLIPDPSLWDIDEEEREHEI